MVMWGSNNEGYAVTMRMRWPREVVTKGIWGRWESTNLGKW